MSQIWELILRGNLYNHRVKYGSIMEICKLFSVTENRITKLLFKVGYGVANYQIWTNLSRVWSR